MGDANWRLKMASSSARRNPDEWRLARLDKSFQDVQLFMNYKCAGDCKWACASREEDGRRWDSRRSVTDQGRHGGMLGHARPSGKETSRGR
jgi:hypothetical protein